MSMFSAQPLDDGYGDGGSSPFAAPQQYAPPPMPPQQTPMGSLAGLAGKVAPFFMPEVPTSAAALNAMGINNPMLLAAIMQNSPGAQQGQVPTGWGGAARQEAARAGLGLGDEWDEALLTNVHPYSDPGAY